MNVGPAVCAPAVRRLFQAADIVIDGHRPWDVRVLDSRFYCVVLRQGSLGFGETYMQKWWSTDDVEEVVYRLIRVGLDQRSASCQRGLLRSS